MGLGGLSSTETFFMPNICLKVSIQVTFSLMQEHGPCIASGTPSLEVLFSYISLSFAFSEAWRRSGRNFQPPGGDLRLPAHCYRHGTAARLHQHHHHSVELWADRRWAWAHTYLPGVLKPGCYFSIFGALLRGVDGRRAQPRAWTCMSAFPSNSLHQQCKVSAFIVIYLGVFTYPCRRQCLQ